MTREDTVERLKQEIAWCDAQVESLRFQATLLHNDADRIGICQGEVEVLVERLCLVDALNQIETAVAA